LIANAFVRVTASAALNFGDCMTYATAALARQPRLCRGDDSRKTDLEIV